MQRTPLAQLIRRYDELSTEQRLAAVSGYSAMSATVLLVLATSYQLSQLTWRLMPSGALSAAYAQPAARAVPPPRSAPAADYGPLATAHLFGEAAAAAAPVEIVEDAPDTTLALTLTGVLLGEGGQPSTAIIAAGQGRESMYGVGQNVDATDATLVAVRFDRVVLRRDERLETLRLPSELTAARATPSATAPAPFGRRARVEEDGVERLADAAVAAPAMRLTDVVQVVPSFDNDQPSGFLLTPGGDGQAFERLGFRSGDVVTSINDRSLDDPSAAGEVLRMLGESTNARIALVRDGVPQIVTIDAAAFAPKGRR